MDCKAIGDKQAIGLQLYESINMDMENNFSHLNFDSEVIKMKEIDGRLIVKCKSPIYEIKKNKNGKFIKYCLTNKCKNTNIDSLINEME